VQTTYVFKLVCDLSIGAISNDLERTLTLFSRSGHSLTLNISQTATVIVFMQLTRDLFAIAKFLFFFSSSVLRKTHFLLRSCSADSFSFSDLSDNYWLVTPIITSTEEGGIGSNDVCQSVKKL